MKGQEENEKVRVILDFHKKEANEIDEYAEICNLATRTAFIRDAYTLFKWAIEEVRLGRNVGSWDNSHRRFKEPAMSSLQAAAKKKTGSVAR